MNHGQRRRCLGESQTTCSLKVISKCFQQKCEEADTEQLRHHRALLPSTPPQRGPRPGPASPQAQSSAPFRAVAAETPSREPACVFPFRKRANRLRAAQTCVRGLSHGVTVVSEAEPTPGLPASQTLPWGRP